MKRVLVVNDIAISSKVLVMQLNKFGITCDVVENGREALAACMRTRYTIVLMDLDMPVMDGFEATRLIRQHEKSMRVHTPILAFTSFDRPENRQKCIREGMDGFLNKGLSADQLMSIIDPYCLEDTASRSAASSAMQQQAGFKADLGQLNSRFAAQTAEIVGEFIFLARGMRGDLERAIGERSSMNLTHSAYSLKGSCSILGLKTMADLCGEIADEGYSGRWDRVSAKYRRLVDMLEEVQEHCS